MIFFKSFINRVLILFITGFIITFPFPFFVIPDFATFISPIFTELNQVLGLWFNVTTNAELSILSDSTGLYLHY